MSKKKKVKNPVLKYTTSPSIIIQRGGSYMQVTYYTSISYRRSVYLEIFTHSNVGLRICLKKV